MKLGWISCADSLVDPNRPHDLDIFNFSELRRGTPGGDALRGRGDTFWGHLLGTPRGEGTPLGGTP